MKTELKSRVLDALESFKLIMYNYSLDEYRGEERAKQMRKLEVLIKEVQNVIPQIN